MPAYRGEKWVSDGAGNTVRRGRQARGPYVPPPIAILDWQDSINSMPTGPISLANLRTLLQNPALPENTAQRARLQINDRGGSVGKVLTIQLIAGTTGQNGGVTWVSALPDSFAKGYLQYDVSFRPGFEWGLGGKILGLAGKTADLATTPDGGNPDPKGWSGRWMWRWNPGGGGSLPNDSEPVGYLYRPLDPDPSFGTDRHTLFSLGGGSATSDGTWHNFKQVYEMNTVTSEGSTTPPSDGLHELWIDDTRYYQNTSEIWRLYSEAQINHFLLSSFWGGSGSQWAGTTDGFIDIKNLKVVKYG